jgi:uncharacterized protein YndB with AHSA1/START domain
MTRDDNQEIRIKKTVQSPIALVWKAWTSADDVIHWWGPDGFTTTIHTMDVRENGEWKLTLHGPNGTNFPNRSIYLEIVPEEKIIFEHFNPHFITTVLMASVADSTVLDWSLRFDSVEERDTIVKAHKADEGLRQNIERLERYLSTIRE